MPFSTFARACALTFLIAPFAPAAPLPPPANAPNATTNPERKRRADDAPKPRTNAAPLPQPAPSDDEPIIIPPGGEAPLGGPPVPEDEPVEVAPTATPAPKPARPIKPRPTSVPTATPTAVPRRTPTRVTPKPRRTSRRTAHSPSPDARFPFLLGAYATPYDARLRGRTVNLRMAARNVNLTVVPSGEVFSANRAIGRRNAEDGWREAKMFVGGRVTTGTGAGICQCSTTLYNAALLAGLPIIERHAHSFRVTYAPPSRDAAIVWAQKDFKFRNATSGPILVRAFLKRGKFHAQLWGVEPRSVTARVQSVVLSRDGGTRSQAFRTLVLEDGTARRERLSRDFYKAQP